eukprot:m.31062 g.31062  ORF g.31062 m.31062 type:complete len:817 (+) comp9287_c0_seq3:25-2475(+)
MAEAEPKQPKAAAGDDKKKEGKKKEKKPAAEGALEVEMNPPAAYIASRIELFDKLYAEYQSEVAAKPRNAIKITLPDGKVVEGKAWETSPYDVAKGISEGLANDTVISKVNGDLWDLERPLEADCNLQLLPFDDPEARAVFWHSSAHVLGEAMELHMGGCLCYGPPIDQGFYYDTFLEGKAVAEDNFPHLETLMKKAVKEKQPFQRLEMTKADLLKMFEYNVFKQRIINEKIDTPTTTVYRCGPLIDLCRGPHIRHTGKIKALSVIKTSSTYWEGKANCETLSRVYGISFPDTKQLKEWKALQEEAAKRDHRKIGKDQELFFFHELSPGSCFFMPHGARIYNSLINFIRGQYRVRGFTEVVTPNMFNSKLWETSGHWQHYADNMFKFEAEKETFALKPMNCPGHCLMFHHRVRSYRELPIRLADFGVLHRNELAGALTGLTRVRRFQQDDAHIFCMPSQIESEIAAALDFLQYVYGRFGFSFQLNLSTRPEGFLGEIAVWDRAEDSLKAALNKFGQPWKLNPGDGAFYGPKIDITILDALQRAHQCATIQLDFQLPIRFGLEYTPAEKKEGEIYRPVIIHRAILGSVERMMAILTESFGGKWPFWLSPRQAMVVPVHQRFNDYANRIQRTLADEGYAVDVDLDMGDTLNKKIRNAQLAQYNFIFVVGEREEQVGAVNVRSRNNEQQGERTIQEVLAHFKYLTDEGAKSDDFPAQPNATASSDAAAPAPAAAAAAAADTSAASASDAQPRDRALHLPLAAHSLAPAPAPLAANSAAPSAVPTADQPSGGPSPLVAGALVVGAIAAVAIGVAQYRRRE